MTIRANIKAKKKAMLNEVGETEKPVSTQISQMGLLAIDRGKGSPEWNNYMALFAEPGNQKQLDRLLAKDDTAGMEEMNLARAYLVADGPCTPDTVMNFGNGASDTLDKGLT